MGQGYETAELHRYPTSEALRWKGQIWGVYEPPLAPALWHWGGAWAFQVPVGGGQHNLRGAGVRRRRSGEHGVAVCPNNMPQVWAYAVPVGGHQHPCCGRRVWAPSTVRQGSAPKTRFTALGRERGVLRVCGRRSTRTAL